MDWSSVADKQVAFLMGSHPRLGERSLLSTLDPAIARAIVRNCRSSSLQLDAPWSWD